MAALIRLALRIDGADLPGMGGPGNSGNTIECLSYEQGLTTSREYGAGMATGRREYTPLVIHKPLDRTSPLLWRALVENRPVEATFYFLRPDAAGAAQVYYSVHIEQARISALRQFLTDSDGSAVPQEEVTFLFHKIAWHSTEGNVGYEDTWTDEI